MTYNFIIFLYVFAARLTALFNEKVSKMVKGQRDAFAVLKDKIDEGSKYLWFHAASLGEFEQGRPLIEAIRRNYPEYKILQTFFSPSGYEVRKNYKGADVVCYLPFDTPRNVRRFIDAARPSMAFFIKYEFWKNYLDELSRRHIPTYSVCSVFRPNQIFFRWYGRSYKKVLHTFTHLFVQNEESVRLLGNEGVTNVSIVGDTRFDRVLAVSREAQELPLLDCFKNKTKTLVVGSSWKADEDIFIPYFNAHPELKLIIAPHVVDESRLNEIEESLNCKTIRYTKATKENLKDAGCLLIDSYGLLSSVYRYGDVAYIGGGFGAGIHNTLEAAVYGIPVIFGPNNKKFVEAQNLLRCNGGFEIQGKEDFVNLMNRLVTDEAFLASAGKNAGRYVSANGGASDVILKTVRL